MAKFRVTVSEVHTQVYEVEANSMEQARNLATLGAGVKIGPCGFSHTPVGQEWPVEVVA